MVTVFFIICIGVLPLTFINENVICVELFKNNFYRLLST